jgi:hypothetical protein
LVFKLLRATYYKKIANTVEKLLHTLSDQQLTAGFALIFAVNAQACTIQAFYYDLVCAMLLMSLVTHLNSIISISKFIHKGKHVATYRSLAMIAQIVLTGLIFQSRNSSDFPSTPNSLAIMPACCFMDLNSTDPLGVSGLGINTAGNASEFILDAIHTAEKSPAFAQYIVLIVFLIFSAVIAIVNWLEAQEVQLHHCVRYMNIATSGIMSIASLAVTVWAYQGYNDLRAGMELNGWYQSDSTNSTTWTFAQIVPLALMASSSITILTALTGTLYTLPRRCNDY